MSEFFVYGSNFLLATVVMFAATIVGGGLAAGLLYFASKSPFTPDE